MTQIRVYELAKKLGVTNKDVMSILYQFNVPIKTHASRVEDQAARKVEEYFAKGMAVPNT